MSLPQLPKRDYSFLTAPKAPVPGIATRGALDHEREKRLKVRESILGPPAFAINHEHLPNRNLESFSPPAKPKPLLPLPKALGRPIPPKSSPIPSQEQLQRAEQNRLAALEKLKRKGASLTSLPRLQPLDMEAELILDPFFKDNLKAPLRPLPLRTPEPPAKRLSLPKAKAQEIITLDDGPLTSDSQREARQESKQETHQEVQQEAKQANSTQYKCSACGGFGHNSANFKCPNRRTASNVEAPIAMETVPFGKPLTAELIQARESTHLVTVAPPVPVGFQCLPVGKLRQKIASLVVGASFEGGSTTFRPNFTLDKLSGIGFLFPDEELAFVSASQPYFYDILQLAFSSPRVDCFDAQSILRDLFRHIQPTQLPSNLHDARVLAWVLEPEPLSFPSYSFAELCFSLLAEPVLAQSPLESFASDLRICSRLIANLTEALVSASLMPAVANEMKIISVLALLETNGISFDSALLRQHRTQIEAKLDWYQQEAQSLLKFPVNLASPKQVSSAIYNVLGLTPPEGTSRHKHSSTEENILRVLSQQHPFPQLVLDFRLLRNLRSNWVDGLAPKALSGLETRIYATWHHLNTATGRLASSEPNLQAVPREEQKFEYQQDRWTLNIRDAFTAAEDCVLVSADYSQMELRILASLSEDEKLIAFFEGQVDFFKSVGSEIFEKSPSSVTNAERQTVKRLIYAVIYGCTDAEAEQFTVNLFTKFSKLKAFVDRIQMDVCQTGEVRTISGRRRQLPAVKSQNPTERARALRQAVNSVIQGSAADVIKKAMLSIQDIILRQPALGARLLLQIHDELVFEVHKDHAAAFQHTLEAQMVAASSLPVKMQVSVSVGLRWGHLEAPKQ